MNNLDSVDAPPIPGMRIWGFWLFPSSFKANGSAKTINFLPLKTNWSIAYSVASEMFFGWITNKRSMSSDISVAVASKRSTLRSCWSCLRKNQGGCWAPRFIIAIGFEASGPPQTLRLLITPIVCLSSFNFRTFLIAREISYSRVVDLAGSKNGITSVVSKKLTAIPT